MLESATTPPTRTTSSARPSRLRRLSYLRSYTQNHLLPTAVSPPTLSRPAVSRTASSPAGAVSRGVTASAASPTDSTTSISGSGERLHASAQYSEPESSYLSTTADMPRNQTTTTLTATSVSSGSIRTPPATVTTASTPEHATAAGVPAKELPPTIKFIPHVEARSGARPSLHFTALSRTLKDPNMIVRVGRYSERDTSSPDANILPVGFKSKVVSRRHCEFWCTNGQWYVKDVKSSSGTFLNHVRLSSPGTESRPFPVNDGDVIQLGIDFKGGEEVIFRCVKIRLECNRGWQKSLNTFNTSAHRRILKNALSKAKTRDSDSASVNSSECSICLNPVAPCQALFVAPCSHVWHYKCVKNLIQGPSYPNFLCPNCRFVADLEADVEPLEEDYLEEFEDDEIADIGDASASRAPGTGHHRQSSEVIPALDTRAGSVQDPRVAELGTETTGNATDEEMSGMMNEHSLDRTQAGESDSGSFPGPVESKSTSQPVNIVRSAESRKEDAELDNVRSTTPTSHNTFALTAGGIPADIGPTTPRNDAGPWVFDGSAGRQRIGGIAAVIEQEPSSSSAT